MKHLRTLACIADVAGSGSIRRSAERLSLTPSALTRKIQEFEQEIGTPLFERTPQGMRLNAAGELVVQHARDQIADLDRVRAQIADLAGARRGQVAIICSQAFVDDVMPDEIEAFRARYPLIAFTILVRDHSGAVGALAAHEAELALLLHSAPAPALHVLFSCQQVLSAIMDAGHPLAGPGPVRLRDCLHFPLAMPDHSLAIRHLLDPALAAAGLPLTVVVESGSIELLRNYVRRENVVSFQLPIGIPRGLAGLAVREVDRRDLAPTRIVLAHLHGCRLSAAAERFVDQVSRNLNQRFGSDES